MQTTHPLRHWLLLATLVVIWGSAFYAVKIAVHGMPPALLVLGRLVSGFAVLVPIAVGLRLRVPVQWQQWRLYALLGLIGNALPFTLVAWGQEIVPSSVAGILMALMPLAIIALAHYFVPGEGLTRQKLAGFVLGFIGITVLVGPSAIDQFNAGGPGLIHELAILAAAFSYAVNTILARRLSGVHPVASAAATLFVASLWALIPALGHADALATIPFDAWLAVLFLGLLPTGLGTVVYMELIRSAGPSFFAITNYLVPIWALAVGATLGAEAIGWNALLALVLVLGGIALGQQRKASRDDQTVIVPTR